jgi:hypothetical protein
LGGPYSQARKLVVQRINFGDLELGPLSATMAAHQNQLIFDRIDLEVMGGVVAGQCFLNFAPGRLMLDFSGRVSGIDGGRLLGFEGLSRQDSDLSGRAALTYAVDSSLVSGRIDVGKVPKSLLDRLLIRLDPAGSDSKVGAARLALGVAVPGRLGVQMGDGLAALEIEILTAAGTSSSIRIPSLPLTRILEERSTELRRSIQWTDPGPTPGSAIDSIPMGEREEGPP